MSFLDRVFTPVSLLLINIVIIVLAENLGGGTYFSQSGWIHGIAILFILLALTRVFEHFGLKTDPVLRWIINASLAALFVFAASHFIEFLSFHISGKYTDQGFASVINMYLASLFLLVAGAEFVLRMAGKKKGTLVKPAVFLACLFAGITLVFIYYYNRNLISLEPDSIMPYVYVAITLLAGYFVYSALRLIKISLVPLESFAKYMMWATAFVVIAAILNALYEVIADGLHVPDYQIVYFSHFLFYGALSVMFLAFGRLKTLGGMYGQA